MVSQARAVQLIKDAHPGVTVREAADYGQRVGIQFPGEKEILTGSLERMSEVEFLRWIKFDLPALRKSNQPAE